MNPSDAIEAIEKPLSSLPYSLSRHILEHLRKLTSHEPVTRECISVGLSATRKVSDAGAAGILNPMPERCLIRGSPVTVFSDNKRHSFHPSGRVFSGRRGFFIYYTSKS